MDREVGASEYFMVTGRAQALELVLCAIAPQRPVVDLEIGDDAAHGIVSRALVELIDVPNPGARRQMRDQRV
jgi:hypothetical protein